MKNLKKVIVTVLIVLAIVAVPICGYLYYDLFVNDEIGEQYEQTWQTDDGSLTLVTNNKKGFILQDNHMFSGSLLEKDNNINVKMGFGANCIVSTDTDSPLFEGDYSYNFFTSELTITITKTYPKYNDMFSYTEFKLHKV